MVKALTIGNGITVIGDYAFEYNSELKEVHIPKSVNSLGIGSFRGCTALEKVVIGSGIKQLQDDTFKNCNSLDNLVIPNTISTIGNYVFSDCTALKDLVFEKGTNASILTLGSNGSSPLFASCPLDEVFIGRKLSYNTSKDYGYSPFYGNTSLRSVKINNDETEIYDNEFYGCSNLQSFECGDGVTRIGNWAFSGCSALTSYSSGSQVSTIGNEAFSDCTALTSFTSKAAVPPVCGTQALDDINKWECTLYVPAASINEYQNAEQWKEFFFIQESSGIENIASGTVPSLKNVAGGIILENAEGTNIEIFDIAGRCIKHITSYQSEVIALPHGVYIVRVGAFGTFKTMI